MHRDVGNYIFNEASGSLKVGQMQLDSLVGYDASTWIQVPFR